MIEVILSHILSFMIFLPLIIGLFIVLFCNDKFGKTLAFVTSLTILALGFYIFLNFIPNGGMQFVDNFSIVNTYGINYSVGIDGINLLILLIVSCAFPPLFFLVDFDKKGYWANLLFMESAFLAVISATDLIFFYAGWEMMLMPIFIFIGIYGKKEDRNVAAMDMMYYAIFGSMIMLCAIIYIGVAHFKEFGFFSFALDDLVKTNFTPSTEATLFFCFMLAFAIKVPLFPFHGWLKDAYTKSPTTATFMLSVIASKVAIFAILRFVLPLFSFSYSNFAWIFVGLGLFSMLYFGVAAIKTKDFKTLLAYASASHLGLIMAGVFSLDVEGFVGSMYQVIAHAITSGIMFLLVGLISKELLTRNVDKLGGIAIKAPIFALFFAIAMISSVGLPGTIGFIGELLIIFGLFKSNLLYGVIATTSIIISAVYMFIVYRKAILQSVNETTAVFKDLSKKQIIAFLAPIVMIFVLGLYSKPFISKIEPTMQAHYEQFVKPCLKEQK